MLNDILKILESDARTTPKQVAAITGDSVAEVNKIIKQAEDDRTILRYKTVINWEKAGEERVAALIEVKVTPQRDVGFDTIAERIYHYNETRSVYLMSGTYDLLVIVAGKTMHEVADFVSQKLAPLDEVQGTVTHFILKRYKEDGDIIQGKGEAKRQPVTF